ncbi:MAG: Uma2 family endonuclease, partial [Limisphaerales bacterium]
YFEEGGIQITPRGQATLRSGLEKAGAEPDESWCLGPEKDSPDLVLEVALTSGGVNKLELYSRFNVPEVWFWRESRLEIFALESSGGYIRSRFSRLFPGLDITLLERCVAIRSWQQARQSFRGGLAKTS